VEQQKEGFENELRRFKNEIEESKRKYAEQFPNKYQEDGGRISGEFEINEKEFRKQYFAGKADDEGKTKEEWMLEELLRANSEVSSFRCGRTLIAYQI
jgi:hypothetical protein